jgi:hypothetical protein
LALQMEMPTENMPQTTQSQVKPTLLVTNCLRRHINQFSQAIIISVTIL